MVSESAPARWVIGLRAQELKPGSELELDQHPDAEALCFESPDGTLPMGPQLWRSYGSTLTHYTNSAARDSISGIWHVSFSDQSARIKEFFSLEDSQIELLVHANGTDTGGSAIDVDKGNESTLNGVLRDFRLSFRQIVHSSAGSVKDCAFMLTTADKNTLIGTWKSAHGVADCGTLCLRRVYTDQRLTSLVTLEVCSSAKDAKDAFTEARSTCFNIAESVFTRNRRWSRVCGCITVLRAHLNIGRQQDAYESEIVQATMLPR